MQYRTLCYSKESRVTIPFQKKFYENQPLHFKLTGGYSLSVSFCHCFCLCLSDTHTYTHTHRMQKSIRLQD